MARGNAIIRRLPAEETLGSVTVICSDKTGTLTRNEMTVTSIATADKFIEVTGAGYEPRGTFTSEGKLVEAEDNEELAELTRASLLCNEASLEQKDNGWIMHGDPTEGALVVAAMKAGLDPQIEKEEYPRLDVIPFESEHRFMATLHHDHQGHHFIYLKGAPEKVIEICDQERHGNKDQPVNPDFWHQQIERIANMGQRTLAIAYKPAQGTQNDLTFADTKSGFTLLGVFGISDPPRDEAITSVRLCQDAGIRVIMITGDHGATAKAIGVELGIGDGKSVLNGSEIENMDDEKLREAIYTTHVVARASPEHKLRLVKILQAANQVVAMTGDGVNDAP